jgi:hypothetical protein
MKNWTRRAAIAALTVSIALAAQPIVAAAAETLADGKADGTLTVNGKVTKVAFAYARTVPGFFDKTKTDVQLILSDVALDAKALGDEFVRIDLAKQGKLHAFEVTVDATGTPISTVWRDNGFKGPTPSGLSSADVFTKKTFDGKTLEGSYKSAAPGDFFDNTYSFDVTFRAAIAH